MSKETRSLIIFFIATFVWTWAWYAPIAISGSSPYTMPWTLMLIMGGMGPSLVGVAMVLLTYDNAARRDYWRRCFSFSRISLGWWAVIFLLCLVILATSIVIDIALGGSPPPMLLLQSLVAAPTLIPLATFIRFMAGPWSEEFGWRGYAQDSDDEATRGHSRHRAARPDLGRLAPPALLHARHRAWPAGLRAYRLLDIHRLQRRTGPADGLGLPGDKPQHPLGDAAVDMDGLGALRITQGAEEGLTIVADDNLLPLIRSDVQGATLRLGFKDGTSINNFSELTYQLTVKNLDALTVDGMALVEGEDLTFERLQAEINGMGTFQLSGSADELDVQINGMGSFDSPELASRVAHVAISGSGNVVVQVSETLDAEIDGAGSVHYIGNPSVTQRVAGAGIVAPR